jgi:hypothetical protein
MAAPAGFDRQPVVSSATRDDPAMIINIEQRAVLMQNLHHCHESAEEQSELPS